MAKEVNRRNLFRMLLALPLVAEAKPQRCTLTIQPMGTPEELALQTLRAACNGNIVFHSYSRDDVDKFRDIFAKSVIPR